MRGPIDDGAVAHLIGELEALPEKIEKMLEDKERIQWFASKYANAKTASSSGAAWTTPSAWKAVSKFKEISYIHSEAYAAGELKHGTISLVEEGTLVVGMLTQQELFEKTVSNLVEVKSRGAYPDGADQLRQLQHRGHRRTSRSMCPRPSPALRPACGGAAAAAGLLRQLCQGPGCRQTAQPGKICHG